MYDIVYGKDSEKIDKMKDKRFKDSEIAKISAEYPF